MELLGLDFKNHPIHQRLRIAQCQDLPAQCLIGYPLCRARKSLAFDLEFDGGVLEHVLAPVFTFNFAGRSIKASLIVDETKFHVAPLASFASTLSANVNETLTRQ